MVILVGGLQIDGLHAEHVKVDKLHSEWRAQEGRVQRLTAETETLAQQVNGCVTWAALLYLACNQHQPLLLRFTRHGRVRRSF